MKLEQNGGSEQKSRSKKGRKNVPAQKSMLGREEKIVLKVKATSGREEKIIPTLKSISERGCKIISRQKTPPERERKIISRLNLMLGEREKISSIGNTTSAREAQDYTTLKSRLGAKENCSDGKIDLGKEARKGGENCSEKKINIKKVSKEIAPVEKVTSRGEATLAQHVK
jgi:hypothetical protein